MALTWHLDIDWNNDGSFEADEVAYLGSVHIERGRDRLIRLDGKGFERQPVGQATCLLNNNDGRFDPYNSSSPLYGQIVPGRECRIRVTSGVTTYTLFRGKIDDLIPVGSKPNRQARLIIADGWKLLGQALMPPAGTASSPQSGKRTDELLDFLLNTEAIWPAAWGTSLGTGSDVLPYFWFEGLFKTVVEALVESEQGQCWVGADGKFNFVGRQSLYGAASSLSLTQTDLLDEVSLPQPWTVVRNVVTVVTHPQVQGPANSVLWSLGEVPLLTPGTAGVSTPAYFYGDFQYNNLPCSITAITPVVATTDYTANSAADGSGTDLTGSLSVIALPDGAYNRVKVSIWNTGASPAYLTKLQVRGTPLYSPYSLSQQADRSSGSPYGPLALSVDLPWQQSANQGYQFAYFLASLLKDGMDFPTIQIRNNPAVQFAYDLFTRLSLSVADQGINADYYIAKIIHDCNLPTADDVTTTWKLEPAAPRSGYWKFTTQLGVTSKLAY